MSAPLLVIPWPRSGHAGTACVAVSMLLALAGTGTRCPMRQQLWLRGRPPGRQRPRPPRKQSSGNPTTAAA
eukprot:13195933-Heterocapsa_arctica.AAC.1